MRERQVTTEDVPAESVIYSFFSKWEESIRQGKVKVFFRKRFPSKKPKRVYFYIGAPKMAVIGSASVNRIERISKAEAMSLAKLGNISRDELSSYLRDRDNVGAIHLGDFEFFSKPVPASLIARAMTFSPPQNFQKLSEDDEAAIQGLGNAA